MDERTNGKHETSGLGRKRKAISFSEQLPPQNPAAERAVLGAIMLGGLTVAGSIAKTLRIEHFYDVSHQRIYSSVLAMVEDGRPIDVLTIAEELGDALVAVGGAPKIAELAAEVVTAENVAVHAAAVIERAVHRSLIGLGSEMLADSYSPRMPAADLVAGMRRRLDHLETIGRPNAGAMAPVTLRRLRADYPAMRRPIIDGVLRETETMNIIAPSKTSKSWLVTDLALAMALGREWLGFQTRPGKVLVIDNELHPETLAARAPRVAEGRGIGIGENGERIETGVEDRIAFLHLRGRLVDLDGLAETFAAIEPGEYQLVILDAWYRFLGAGTDENNNAAIAAMYNQLDKFAARLRSAFVLIHHSSKGSQADKSVTDVGAGAGSQSRAADVHMVIREHSADNHYVIDGMVRSFPPIAPKVVRWEFPLFHAADDLDPTDLKRRGGFGLGGPGGPGSAEARQRRNQTTPAEFAETYVDDPEGVTVASILAAAAADGWPEKAARTWLKAAAFEGLLWRKNVGDEAGYTAYENKRDRTDQDIADAIRKEHADGKEISIRDIRSRWGINQKRAYRVIELAEET